MFSDFKKQLKDSHLRGPEEILTTFQELSDNLTFEELEVVFEPCRYRLLWSIEHHGEYSRK
jgi:hypothetical protein